MSPISTYTALEPLLPGYEGESHHRYTDSAGLAWLASLNDEQNQGELLFRQRNRVYRLPDPIAGGNDICIKVFKQPGKLRSAWYRRTGSKAQRAHAFARHLYEQGAAVAEPLGYLERWNGNQLVESLLISRYLTDSTDLYSEMTYLLRQRPYAGDYIRLLRVCAEAIRTMHDSGFLHNDLGPQNILLQRTGPASWANPTFIDLNRGQLVANPSYKQRARDLDRMKLPSHFLRIFRHIYWNDGPIPKEFERWADRYRARFRRHQRSRKWRHPIRTIRQWLHPAADEKKQVSTGQPSERDAWLWDEYSGQPSVMLRSPERRRERRGADIWPTLFSNLRKSWSIWRSYRQLKSDSFQTEVNMNGRFGVCVEVDETFEQQLQQLKQTPGLSVFVRLYFHLGQPHLDAAAEAIKQLAEAGHPVGIGLVQSRQAVLDPAAWQAFMAKALARVHSHIHCVEIGHAVNRVKWGLWNLEEMSSLWHGAAQLKAQYPEIQFIGPAVNDFEFQYYPPLLDAGGEAVDALSCHLYVDRRGAPENAQNGFTTLEKALLGKAIAKSYNKTGFYITEVNWPLQNTGLYSPLAGAYQYNNQSESRLHINELDSAAYMIRYALITLCSGATERLWWWRLAHPGFGLVDNKGGWRERPGWKALLQFHRTVGQASFEKRKIKDGITWWYFDNCIVAYSLDAGTAILPPADHIPYTLLGEPIKHETGQPLALDDSPIYFIHR
ncbi:lipopolysaccharide kinase InaA family protein [Saccharospirillum sp. HFRX-1]|uniref:lipopolysaccharide kinase InaA family protein n=1 Tax=unclassified Saccharospirillum TaxID=2633430 RepID=UPI00371C97F6